MATQFYPTGALCDRNDAGSTAVRGGDRLRNMRTSRCAQYCTHTPGFDVLILNQLTQHSPFIFTIVKWNLEGVSISP